MPNQEPNELDQIINRALASYVEGQPSPNLEHRVLDSIHHATNRRLRISQWAVATPLLAASLLLLVAHYVDHRLPAEQPIAANPATRPTPTTAPAPTKASAAFPKSRQRPHHPTAVAQSAPTYLTVSGPALAALAHERPEQLQALFAREEQPHAVAPVSIDDIDFKPIATEPLQ
jgi:hypothetical protein